ncbi:MAG: EF2563 family selenium-dependent molybdenum hydroxylase system protein [Anaerolinea sp.]|nr:EF2563 family selenium-dependent molybdenum hydroxylase system protein [Anaerolinea sp.]
MNFSAYPVCILGAGELASGVAVRLWRAGFPVWMTELPQPLAIRRTVCFSEAIYSGQTRVEEITAQRLDSPTEIPSAWAKNILPVLIDEAATSIAQQSPTILLDGRMIKRNLGIRRGLAPLVLALGPGFCAGQDVDAVIETNRGHHLGRVLWQGTAEADTGTPGEMRGVRSDRVLYSPCAGVLISSLEIGASIRTGQTIAWVNETPVISRIDGVLRGLIHPGLHLPAHIKIADVDPRADPSYCHTVSDKALAIGGGVLEAILQSLH